MNQYLYLFFTLIILGCSPAQSQHEPSTEQSEEVIEPLVEKFDPAAHFIADRSEIVKALQEKVDRQEPLVAHCFVPLCDNKHQGIVPTSPSLGDGFSLRTNLYWATSYGMKKYFQKSKDWKMLEISFTATDTVMERVAFQREFENGATVILVCDAYRGDQMAACLDDYLNALGGNRCDSIFYRDHFVPISGGADLLAFNGHNGLMDVSADTVYAKKPRQKDAVVIACSSHNYFNPYFVQTQSYPLLNTTSLLWPGAMILNAVIEKWAVFSEDEAIRNAAGDAYHEVKDCGRQAARNMFITGW
ncbi:MAG: hypothetical protein WDZ35_16145 [Crocinitomicaceae bacterium]